MGRREAGPRGIGVRGSAAPPLKLTGGRRWLWNPWTWTSPRAGGIRAARADRAQRAAKTRARSKGEHARRGARIVTALQGAAAARPPVGPARGARAGAMVEHGAKRRAQTIAPAPSRAVVTATSRSVGRMRGVTPWVRTRPTKNQRWRWRVVDVGKGLRRPVLEAGPEFSGQNRFVGEPIGWKMV